MTLLSPTAEMRREHGATSDLLRGVEHVTNGLTLPERACRSWTAPNAGLRTFTDDLVTHIHLENAILFPRIEAAS